VSISQPILGAIPIAPKPDGVHLSDRLLDMAALALVVGGVALFTFARRALSALAGGTFEIADGAAQVVRTDLHVAQTRLAMWLIVIGVVIAIMAAIRHRLRRR